MTESKKKAVLKSRIEQVWEVVTDLSDCSWRSDLQRIDVLEPGKTFVEYTKEGFPTTFVITRFEPPYRYEFTHGQRQYDRYVDRSVPPDGRRL